MKKNELSQRNEDYVIALKNSSNVIIGGVLWKNINQPYQKYLFDDTNIQIFFGGGSSGKSHFIFQRTILDVWLQGRNFLIARQKKNTIETSVYTELIRKINDFGLNDKFEWKKNPFQITCKENGRQILFVGLDDIESVKSIVPIDGTFTDVIVEEATEIKEKDFDQLRIRQRGICYKKSGGKTTNEELTKRITLMFNPINKSHWIYKRFFIGHFDDDDKEVRYTEEVNYDIIDGNGEIVKNKGIETFCILKTTYRDNNFLSQDDIIKLENTKDPVQRDVYVNGNWGSLGKTVYQKNVNWFIQDLTEMIPTFKVIRNGLDFGGSIDEHAYTKSCYDKKNKIIYIFDEFKMNEIGISELWYQIKDKANSMPIICDRNEDMIKQLRQAGGNPYRARKGKNSILNGIEWLKGNTIIIDKGCKETIYEFENYTWKTDRYGEPIGVPIDKYNHLCLVGDTKVKTVDGEIAIKDLVGKSGLCYCYDTDKKEIVISNFTGVTLTQKDVEIYELELENGNLIRGTYNHPILTKNGWKELGKITEKDEVVILNKSEKTKIEYIENGKIALYDGYKFIRDDKTGYYLCSKNHKRLHRYVYEKRYGKIKKGYDIHHIDLDKNNNDINNLIMLSKRNHMQLHGYINNKNEELVNRMTKQLHSEDNKEKARLWHKSEDGRIWHEKHYKKMKDKLFVERNVKCLECGKLFKTKTFHTKFCSNACKSRYRRKTGKDNITKKCVFCGKEYDSNRYAKAKFCSRKCYLNFKSEESKKNKKQM